MAKRSWFQAKAHSFNIFFHVPCNKHIRAANVWAISKEEKPAIFMCFPKLIHYWINQHTNFKKWVQHTVQKKFCEFHWPSIWQSPELYNLQRAVAFRLCCLTASPSPITWFNIILNPLPSALVQNRTDPTTACKVTSHANWLCLF
jgi:benzoyl-CoA reductase/2-hydroxyglutaryl-CoA dehydratase subunit BcrC/BadD/HgdB